MYKPLFQKHEVIVFRQFRRKGYSLFACLGREVVISVLSVATLSSAQAVSISEEPFRADSTARVDRELWLGDVGVTGSRAPLATGQASRMVTVLSREDIQAAPVQSVNDLLKLAAGVDVRQRGPIGAQTDVSIRGGTHEQIALLLNGVNIGDPQTGHNAVDLPVSLGDIERIEVLEGPAGRVVGTSSLLGAINIVTKSAAAGEPVQLGAEAGSYGYLSATSRLPVPNLHTSLSATYTRSDGFQRSAAGNLNSDYNGVKLFCYGDYKSSSAGSATDGYRLYWQTGLSIRDFGSNTFYSARFDEQFEHTAKLSAALQGEWRQGCLLLTSALYWNHGYDRFELVRGIEQTVPFNRHRTDVIGTSLGACLDTPLGRTALGAEFRNEDIVSTNLGEQLTSPHGHYVCGLNRTKLNLHVEHNVVLSWLTLSAGFVCARNTGDEQPFRLYPGVDASLRVADSWKVYASYNTSLRTPSFTELYYSVGGHKADKHLKPEEMRAVEGGVKYITRNVEAKASVFHHHGRNMIDWVMDTTRPDAVWQSVNHTRVNTFGQEVSVRLALPMGRTSTPHSNLISRLTLSYCHLNQQKDEREGLQSQYVLEYLRHKLTATLLLPLTTRLSLTLSGRWQDRTGSYTDTAGTVSDYRPYCLADARLTWAAPRYSLYVEGNNLTNTHYVDYGNVRQPGLWLRAGAELRL